MIERYYPSQPYGIIPKPPFVKIGLLTNHHSTGTVYTQIFSDDPKNDIPDYLYNSFFELDWKFAPIMYRNGVECHVKPRRALTKSLWECLLVPVENASIYIGDRSVILAADEYYQMTLERLISQA